MRFDQHRPWDKPKAKRYPVWIDLSEVASVTPGTYGSDYEDACSVTLRNGTSFEIWISADDMIGLVETSHQQGKRFGWAEVRPA